jgi:hypothetical protein
VAQQQVVERLAGNYQRTRLRRNGGSRRMPLRRDDLIRLNRTAVLRDRTQHAHVVECTQRSRREPVAAGLVTRELGSIQDKDVQPVSAQQVARG